MVRNLDGSQKTDGDADTDSAHLSARWACSCMDSIGSGTRSEPRRAVRHEPVAAAGVDRAAPTGGVDAGRMATPSRTALAACGKPLEHMSATTHPAARKHHRVAAITEPHVYARNRSETGRVGLNIGLQSYWASLCNAAYQKGAR